MIRTFCLVFFEIVRAHGIEGASPAKVFEFKFAWDPTLIFFALMTYFYVRGLISYRNRPPVSHFQVGLFFLGITILLLACLPPIDTAADQLFSAHMIQHLLITSVGVPLVLFGSPFFVGVRGLPSRFRTNIAVPVLRFRLLRSVLKLARQPLLAVFLFEGTLWFWHIPRFYNRALLNDYFHLLEHACMALAAMNLWRLLIDPGAQRSQIKYPVRLLFLGFLATLDMALSAALTYSERVWYAYDRLPLPSWWSWDRLQDQRLGGLIMWVPGGMIWLLAMIAIFWVWTKHQTVEGLI